MRYHHLGVPTDRPREGEVFLPGFGTHVVPFDSNPFGIEWIRFEVDSPLPELVRARPHLAFQVDNLEVAMEGHEVLIQPNSPSEGVRVCFIVYDGAPVELMEFHGHHPDRLEES
jgi:hypothetical protein